MTDQRIEGAVTEAGGKLQNGLGRLTGDSKLQVEGKLNEFKGKAQNAYGRVIDGLDGMVDKAPADLRDPARKGLDFARRKPLLTTGIIAGAAVLLGALGRKRCSRPSPLVGEGGSRSETDKGLRDDKSRNPFFTSQAPSSGPDGPPSPTRGEG